MKNKLQKILDKKGPSNYSKGLKDDVKLLNMLKEVFGDLSLPELFYLGLYDQTPPICKNNKKLLFKSLKDGYRKYCGTGKNCPCRQESHSEKIKSVWRNRTSKEKETLFNKAKKTSIMRYGSDNPVKNTVIQEKIKQTNLKKHGVEYPLQSKKIQDKIKQTNLKNHGVEYPLQSKKIFEKTMQTSIEKYDGLMTHARKLLYEKYNGNPFSDNAVREKIKTTLIKNYGVDHPSKSPELILKRTEKYYKKYKRYNPAQLHLSDEVWSILQDKELFSKIYNEKGLIGTTKFLKTSDGLIAKYVDKHKLKRRGYRSSYENSISEFLKSLNIIFIQDNRTICKEYNKKLYEIDFVIPDKKICIEFNGLYYHSEISGNKQKNYHKMKLDACEKKGYQLITIFEDEFLDNSELVYNMLKNKLGISEKGVFGRKCIIKEIAWKETKEFLDKHHVQKAGNITKNNIAAIYKNKIVAVMSFGLNISDKKLMEIKRYATNGKNNPGVASKLFNYFLNKYNPDKVLSYADRRWSQGNLYYKLGFKLDKTVPPNYWYLENYYIRLHRSNFTKGRIRKKFNLDKDYVFKEVEFMNEHGYDRIWDCGNLRFIYEK